MTWLRNEASALKAKVSGLTVSDANAPSTGRPVAVRFNEPQTELGDTVFPMVLLAYNGITRATDRESRGYAYLPYYTDDNPSGGNYVVMDSDTGTTHPWVEGEDERSPFWTQDAPVPYDIDFTVTVMTRLATHMEQLIVALSKIDRLPTRFGYLEIPEDGTVRSLFLMAGPEYVYARDDHDKRLFKAVYMVRVASELPLYAVDYLTQQVTSVNVSLSEI